MNSAKRWILSVAVPLLLSCPPPSFADASIGSIAKPPDPPGRAVPAKSLALANQARISDWIRLDPPADSEYLAADNEGLAKGVKTIGMVRGLPSPAEWGKTKKAAWSVAADGTKVWAIVLESPTATGIRIGLDRAALPPGASIRVASFADPSHAVGPYGPSALVPGERFWTETVFDQAVALECQVPAASDESLFALSIEKIAHLYAPPDILFAAKVGNCHNDVTCADSNWRAAGNSVAGIGTVGDSGVLWCTGTLLNNAAQNFVDYFLTANHCVANQTEASSTEFYWFYQTSSCNGTPPNPASVPRTGQGADYLAGRTESQANDFAFLKLRQATPGGVVYSGWTTNNPGSSAAVKGIHHPDGSFKRISHGALTSSDANFWYLRWSSGVTEPGSSGSPLFNSSRQLIGQLYGGYSSCILQSGVDEYGRFDKTYPLVAKWLSPWDSGYQDIGNGWRRLAWFGDYSPVGSAGWIWHNKHKFMFVSANSVPSGIWFFTQDMGWLWTSSSIYPYLYRFGPAGWLWYNGSTNPRWFRNMSSGQWESRP